MYSLFDIPDGQVPFRAQHLVLQMLQRHMEIEAFRFVRQWLPTEAHAAGWSCAEALELHKLFPFLAKHHKKIPLHAFWLEYDNASWRQSISQIRHATVHRLVQDRDALLKMSDDAIGFVWCIAGPSSAQKFGDLRGFLQDVLPQTRQSQGDRPPTPPVRKGMGRRARDRKSRQDAVHRSAILPGAVGKIIQVVEDEFVHEFHGALQTRFPVENDCTAERGRC